MAGNKLLAYPSSLGDNSTAVNYNSSYSTISASFDTSGGDRFSSVKNFADKGRGNNIESGAQTQPYIMFEFIKMDYADHPDVDIDFKGKAPTAAPIPTEKNQVAVKTWDDGAAAVIEKQREQWNAAYKAWKPKQRVEDTAILYMTPSIQIGDSMNYHEDTRMMAASIEGLLEGGLGYIKSLGASDTASLAIHAAPAIGLALGNALTGGLLGTFFGGSGADAIKGELERNRGKTINPNEYLRYKSTGLRSFSFGFKFLPDSPDESIMCKEIIQRFRVAAHADRETAITLKVPDQVVVSFHGVKDMIQLPPLVITAVNVTYGPTAATVFSDNAPVEMDFSVTLQEITPIYQQDVKDGF